jgi:D-beta-D-heptose 7-phosphate kinase/D-beta-D-heptose 1-phosphate adenosyltransferase
VIHEADRARVMAALEAVDAVILFDQDTPLELIHAIRPDVLAKGSDYTEEQVVGGTEVKSWGGKVALVELVPGRSTSGIIGKLGS